MVSWLNKTRWIEPVLIAFVCLTVATSDYQWPTELSVGHFVLVVSLFFMVQTLARDLVLLYKLKTSPNPEDTIREGKCFCVESVLGTVVLLLGIGLFVAGAGGHIVLDNTIWLVTITLTMIANYLLRDYVFSWQPFRIYRDPNHLNIVPRF